MTERVILSAALAAILKPTSDIIDEPASERLLKASAITDTAPDTNPAISLPRKSMILRTIPVHEPR